jgi:protein-L-isoaspartate(D-aspartate) O-methyltransferase
MLDFSALRQHMVDNQLRPSEVTDYEVIRAFLTVPREVFAEPSDQAFAYSDRELKMSPSAPARRMTNPVQLARLIHALPRGPDIRTLVVGCGSGYSAALLAHLVGAVTTLEEHPELAALARENLARVGAINVSVVEGKLVEGYPADAPYDGILVDGAVEFVTEAMVTQLKQGGLLATIERRDGISRAMLYERVGKDAAKWPLFEAWATLLPGFERKPEFVF